MKKLIYFFSLFLLLYSCRNKSEIEKIKIADQRSLRSMQASRVTPYALKTAAYWTHPIMSQKDALSLAKHDIVIVDLENKFNNRNTLLYLKRLNPNVKILAYSNPMEIYAKLHNTKPWQNQVINYITKMRTSWMLMTVGSLNGVVYGNYARYYPGMLMLNMSEVCPEIEGQKYYEWMADKLIREVLSDPIFNGYFEDNGTWNVSWMYLDHLEKIDIDYDGRAEKDAYIDKQWERGQTHFLKKIKKYGKKRTRQLRRSFPDEDDFIIITNKGDLSFLDKVDGKFFEKFPNDYLGDKWAGGWLQCIQNAEKTGPYTIFHVERDNIDLGIASSLLLDNVYLAIGQDVAGYFPELDVPSGPPSGPFRKNGEIYERDFKNFKIKVYPLERRGEIVR